RGGRGAASRFRSAGRNHGAGRVLDSSRAGRSYPLHGQSTGLALTVASWRTRVAARAAAAFPGDVGRYLGASAREFEGSPQRTGFQLVASADRGDVRVVAGLKGESFLA